MILRQANFSEVPVIWDILRDAIEQRRVDGSEQWQDGYPNEQTVQDDITNGYAYVLVENEVIIAYAAIIFGIDPTYINIKGSWLSNDNYVVVHRVATATAFKGKGIAKQLFKLIEDLSVGQQVYSIKVDTNFDNAPMIKIMDKLGYIYCGEILFEGSPRKAYEKILDTQ